MQSIEFFYHEILPTCMCSTSITVHFVGQGTFSHMYILHLYVDVYILYS